MFKLESYITPLLLNYVNKYIKNLKPEDSQVSLWGGDAVFCNLDLRLDVLEQELHLPFTFKNGHIHELRIHVPWTKLGSEPVIITINTIECVLKLSSSNDSRDSNAWKAANSTKIPGYKTLKKSDLVEAPPGYVQSLINRVISNICIVCNNVILKYVEDDIVLSLNIKSVELFNANEKWEKVFVDTNIADLIFRKVIFMQDLTVCLDKRDASGKIEIYQDPLLYRCSSTWRMYSVYNSSHSKYPSLTRIHMFCESLELSLTDQQLPMFLRLMALCIALHTKSNLTSQENMKCCEESIETKTYAADEEQEVPMTSHDSSWSSWAWSFVPEVGYIWGSSESKEEQEKEANILKSKKIFQFGVYIGKSSCILKHTLSQDPSCSLSSKNMFAPLMILKMYGCFIELTSKGKDYVNAQSGICCITVTRLQDCTCGIQDLSNSNEMHNIFLKSGVPPGSGHAYSFLSSSLFDPLAAENCNQERKYCFNWTEHLSTLTEEVMVQRFPAFAFDYLYHLDVPDEWKDRISNITTSFLEDSNWQESSTCRLVFGPFCIDVTSSLVHRTKKLILCAQDYDYPYYAQFIKESTHPVTVNEEVLEQMEEYVSIRQYHLTFFKPVLRLSIADHFPCHSFKLDNKKGKKRSAKSSKHIKPPKAYTIFCLEIYADCVDWQTNIPMYPNRLVKIIGNLTNPSQFLLHHCFKSTSLKVFGLEFSLHKGNWNHLPLFTIVQQTSLTFFQKSLILPDNWNSSDGLILQEGTFECNSLHFKLSEIAILALIAIYKSWTVKYFNSSGLEKLKLVLTESEIGSPVSCFEICDINFLHSERSDLTFTKLAVSSLSVKFIQENNSSTLFHSPELTACMPTGINSKLTEGMEILDDEEERKSFLQLLLQVPKNKSNENPVLLVLHISGSMVYLEPALFSWMLSAFFSHINLDNLDFDCTSQSSMDKENASTSSSITHEASFSQSFSKSHSTVLMDHTKETLHQKIENFLLKNCQFLSFLILEVNIGSLCGLMPQHNWSVKNEEGVSTLQTWQKAEIQGRLEGTLLVCLPTIKIKNNSSASNFLRHLNITEMCEPIKNLQYEMKNEGYFPWTLQLHSFSVYTIEKSQNSPASYAFFSWPTNASATIALSLKNNQNQLALCVHMDCRSVQISLSSFQANLLECCFCTLSSTTKFMKRLNSWINYFCIKISDSPEFADTLDAKPLNPNCDIKNVFDDNNHCKKTLQSESIPIFAEEPKIAQKLTLWIQLTLSKLCIVALGRCPSIVDYDNFKVQLDCEEIVSSLDMQDVYSKTKLKLTSLNINCFIKHSERLEWQPGTYKGKVLFCINVAPKNLKSKSLVSNIKPDNQAFLVATFTQALHSNVKEKLSSDLNPKVKPPTEDLKYISEIDLKIKSFGIIVWMSLFDLLYQISHPFLKTFSVNQDNVDGIGEQSDLKGVGFCSQNLPLFYIETNIIQIYLPENCLLTNDLMLKSKYVDKNKVEPEVLLLQLDSVMLTSQVENPLPRIILNSDVYANALMSKTITLPGAAIEDRQYQMDIFGFSFGTISGPDILYQSELKKEFISHYPLTMGENPALEWNIGVIPESRNEKEFAMITPVISPFNLRIAIAPAIVCDSLVKDSKQKKIVVAGISSEISVTSEVSLYLSIHQTCVIYSLLKSNINLLFEIFHAVKPIEVNRNPLTLDSPSYQESVFLPSNLVKTDSSVSPLHSFGTKKRSRYEFVPFEMLITAGSVSIMLYYHENESQMNKMESQLSQFVGILPVKSNHLTEKSSDYVLKHEKYLNQIIFEEISPMVKLFPFLCLSIIQPHSYLLCHPSSQKFESSCFDLQLCGSPADYVIKKPHKSCTPVKDDFNKSYLETKPGEPNEKTGIPPAFFTVTVTNIFNDPADIKISVERPVKLNFRNEILDAVISFIHCLDKQLKQSNISETKTECEDKFEPDTFPIRKKFFTYFKNIVFCSSQMVLEFTPLLNASSERLIFSVAGLEIQTEIKACIKNLKSLETNMRVSSFVVYTSNCDEIWNFIQPLTFSTKMKFLLKPCLQLELCLTGECLLINFSLHHILHSKKLILAIKDTFEKSLSSIKNIFHSRKGSDVNPSLISTIDKKKEYWYDDLRKGAFQFIQNNESVDVQPKANEIVFSRASNKQPASMTWCYPEPRTLTRIDVSPVPFQSSDVGSNKNGITCYVQYWNSTYQDYINFCDFVLSETNHFCLDLSDLTSDFIAMSDKWRVLLDCGNYDDDDGNSKKSYPDLSPLALAACMAVDSCFEPSMVSTFQTKVTFDLVKLIFCNSFKNSGHNHILTPFVFDDENPVIHELAISCLLNPSFSFIKQTSKIKGQLSAGVTCEVLEYRNLTMLPVINQVEVSGQATIHFDKEKVQVIDIDFVLQPSFIRISQSIFHTLTYSIHSIAQEISIDATTQICSEYMLPNYYIVCNNLEERIRFGQAGTEENIILSPLKMHAYSWWCHKSKQVLWISVGSLCWKWSNEFNIDKEGIFSVELDKNTMAIITVKKLSNLQRQVVIDGQLKVYSQLCYPIQLCYEFPGCTLPNANPSTSIFIKSLEPQCSSPAFLLTTDKSQSMLLSVTGILDSKLWSKKISFRDNKFLQIPWEAKGKYQTVWCKVVEQKISFNISSFSVFISPLFMLRSNIHLPLRVEATSQNQEDICSIKLMGRGQEATLYEILHNETNFELSFQTKCDVKISITSLTMSLSDMEQLSFKDFDINDDLSEKFKTMQSVHHKLWPYSFIERQSTHIHPLYPCFEPNSVIVPAVASNDVCCKLKVECSQRWTGLNTILYDILPEMVLVNRLRTNLFLFNELGMEWMLPPNSVALPSQPYENFRLGVLDKGEYFYSSWLSVEANNKKNVLCNDNSKPAFFSTDNYQRVPWNGSVNVLIKVQSQGQKVFLFKLNSEEQEGIFVITAFPLIVLTNETNRNLEFTISCAPSDADNVSLPSDCPVSFVFNNDIKNCYPLLYWEASCCDVSYLTNAVILSFYLSLRTSPSLMWSYPVCLHSKLNENNRHTISVPVEFGSTAPLVLTSHWRNGMLFLVLDNDPCPLLMLHNRTSFNILYGQSCLKVEGKSSSKSVFEELTEFAVIPILAPRSSAHYSFPLLFKQFPQVPDKYPMLCFGLIEDTSNNYAWSAPFKVNVDKQFVHVFGICDFMVLSDRNGHTVNLYIHLVNRIEVTANEVRSRISLSTGVNSHNNKKESVKTKTSSTKTTSSFKERNTVQSSTGKKSSSTNSMFSTKYYINLRLIHVSLIVCDEFEEVNRSIEVLRLNIDNIILVSRPINNSKSKLQDLSMCFEHIQLDNQINGNSRYDFPVILNRHIDLRKQTEIANDYDNMYLPNKIREKSMLVLNSVIELSGEECLSILMQTLDIECFPIVFNIEDVFYYKIMDLFKTYIPISFHYHEVPWSDIYIPKDVKCISTIFINPVHFQSFKLNIHEVSLSLHASLKIYLSLEHSLLRFQPFEKQDLFSSHYEIGRMLVLHYFTGALFKAGWVVASLDLLGNPAGFARAIGAGMSDFVYLPYKGLLQGPRAFISGLTTGAVSLFTQISSGAITCMASLALSISKNMDFLSLDNEHLTRHELIRRHLPQGISEGLTQGLSVFGLSILGAVAGIVDHPLQVLVSPSTPLKTASGILSGFGKGIVGAFTKPIGGAAELFSQAGYGILHGTGWLVPPKRRYEPITLSLELTTSSLMKYLCKVALCQSLGNVLMFVEATYVNDQGEYEKNILLLTYEALCILGDDEVTLHRTFALTEIRCQKSKSDRSTLIIIPSFAFRKELFLDSGDALDRVAEYLKKSQGESSNAVENTYCQDGVLDTIKSSSSCHVFFLYPKDRSLFLTLFNYAKSKALRKGF